MNEITISVKDFSDRMRNLLREEAQLAADRKELEMQGKASGINVAPIKKWLKAEVQDEEASRPTKITRLIAQTQDQVLYGESLGHDLGIIQNDDKSEKVIVQNNSNPVSAARPAEPAPVASPEAAEGGDADFSPASSPDISAHVTAPQRMPDSGEDRVASQPVLTSPRVHSSSVQPVEMNLDALPTKNGEIRDRETQGLRPLGSNADGGRPPQRQEGKAHDGGIGGDTGAVNAHGVTGGESAATSIHEASAIRAPSSAALSEAEYLGPIPHGLDRRAAQ